LGNEVEFSEVADLKPPNRGTTLGEAFFILFPLEKNFPCRNTRANSKRRFTMKKQWVLICIISPVLFLAFGVGLTVRSEAAVSDEISIQGRLTDANGNPISGTRTITFTLYDSSVGGTVVCQDVDAVSVVNGLFSARMGFCTASDVNGRQLYLGMQVEGDPEMTPRQAILAAPYAWSLRPGAIISDTVAGDAVLHAENSATTGRGLRGYATAASGTNFGVVGRSSSPDGYGGYFTNVGSGYAICAEGGIKLTVNAGNAKPITPGDRYRDNAIVAWAKVSSDGSIGAEFGLTSVTKDPGAGSYLIALDANAASTSNLIPIAIAEIESSPANAAGLRIVSINQASTYTFRVYVNNGTGTPVDNDFVFMVTAR
jgi:hypothetical protein